MSPVAGAAFAALLSLAMATPAAAQRCMGGNPWSRGNTQLGVTGVRSSANRGFGGGLAFGHDFSDGRSAFAGARFRRLAPVDDPALVAAGGVANPSYGGTVEAGSEFPLTAGGRITICPVAGGGYSNGPELLIPDRGPAGGSPAGELEIESAGLTLHGGFWMGGAAPGPVARWLTPAVGLHVVHQRTTRTAEGTQNGILVDSEEVQRETWLRLALAAGINVARRVVLRPSVALPVTAAGPRATVWAVDLSVSFTS